MLHIKKLVLGLCGLLLLAGVGAGPALGYNGDGSFYPSQAERASRAAHRAAIRAAERDREARRVLVATRQLKGIYGTTVARWVQCARRAGFGWGDFGVLFAIIDRESGGGDSAQNPSGASGLTQQMPGWWNGDYFGWVYDPLDAYQNLRHAHMAYHRPGVGWSPWTPVPASRWSPPW